MSLVLLFSATPIRTNFVSAVDFQLLCLPHVSYMYEGETRRKLYDLSRQQYKSTKDGIQTWKSAKFTYREYLPGVPGKLLPPPVLQYRPTDNHFRDLSYNPYGGFGFM